MKTWRKILSWGVTDLYWRGEGESWFARALANGPARTFTVSIEPAQLYPNEQSRLTRGIVKAPTLALAVFKVLLKYGDQTFKLMKTKDDYDNFVAECSLSDERFADTFSEDNGEDDFYTFKEGNRLWIGRDDTTDIEENFD